MHVETSRDPDRILVRCPNWVGDVVMATPAIRALRVRFPKAHISVFLKTYVRPLLDGCPYVDEIIEYDPDRSHLGVSGYYRLLGSLRGRRYDLGLILPNSFRAAWEMRFIGVPRRVGYRLQGRGWLLTDAVEAPRDGAKRRIVNMVDYYLALCKSLGCSDLDRREELCTTPSGEASAQTLLAQHGISPDERVIAVAPGAGYGPSKLYPVERYARVMDMLADRHRCRLLVITSPREQSLAEELATRTAHPLVRIESASLDALKSILKRCSLLITNDTGPRHIAVAFGKPVVVVMGPTSPLYTDVNLEKTFLVREPVECSPCQLKVCPIDHRCMTRISPERVVLAAETLLDFSGDNAETHFHR